MTTKRRRIIRGNPSSPAQAKANTASKLLPPEQAPPPINDLDNADTLDNFVVDGNQSPAQAIDHPASGKDSPEQEPSSARALPAVDGPSPLPVDQGHSATRIRIVDREGWTELRIRAENFHDAQEARITVNNRADRGGVDKAEYLPQIEATRSAEESWKKFLLQQYRRTVPEHIRAWQDETPGVGEHTLARLLGHIGHPVLTIPHRWEGSGEDRVLLELEPMERRVSDLWSYCGHGDPTRKRRKGMTAEDAARLGNPKAKVALRLLAYQAVRQIGGVNKAGVTMPRSPYRDVYEKRKAITAERASWEGTRDAHRHEDALRIVGKEILRDLWKVAHG